MSYLETVLAIWVECEAVNLAQKESLPKACVQSVQSQTKSPATGDPPWSPHRTPEVVEEIAGARTTAKIASLKAAITGFVRRGELEFVGWSDVPAGLAWPDRPSATAGEDPEPAVLLGLIGQLRSRGFELKVWVASAEVPGRKVVEHARRLRVADLDGCRRPPDRLVLPLMAHAAVVCGYLSRVASPFFADPATDRDRRLAMECAIADRRRLREVEGRSVEYRTCREDPASAALQKGPEPAGVRPPGVPLLGLPARGRIVTLVNLTASQWRTAGITLVSGLESDGWTTWYPLESSDSSRCLALREELKRERRERQKLSPRERPAKEITAAPVVVRTRRQEATRRDPSRSQGEARPLCWLPEPQLRHVWSPLPGKREDGKLWFE
jgi:hypothetical protein